MMSQFLFILLAMTIASAYAQVNFIGSWKVTDFVENQAPMQMPQRNNMVLTLKSDDEVNYHITMIIGNRFMGGFKVVSTTSDGVATIETGGLAGTRMMPPPAMQPFEQFMSQMWPAMNEMFVVSDILTIKGPSAKIVCERSGDISGSS